MFQIGVSDTLDIIFVQVDRCRYNFILLRVDIWGFPSLVVEEVGQCTFPLCQISDGCSYEYECHMSDVCSYEYECWAFYFVPLF